MSGVIWSLGNARLFVSGAEPLAETPQHERVTWPMKVHVNPGSAMPIHITIDLRADGQDEWHRVISKRVVNGHNTLFSKDDVELPDARLFNMRATIKRASNEYVEEHTVEVFDCPKVREIKSLIMSEMGGDEGTLYAF